MTLTNTVSDSIVEKIRKLLALASELNDSKEQAEEALKKAKALAVQHEVDIAAIAVFEAKKSEEPIEKDENISLGKRQSVCQKFISWLLQSHFKVKIVYSGGRYFGKTMVLIGKRSDIEIATYVNNFLNAEFMRLWHQYRKANPFSKTNDRNSFFWGLHEGLAAKLEESNKETKEEAFSNLSQTHTSEQVEQVKSCFALTVTTDKERLADAVKSFYGKLRHTTTRVSYGHSGEAREAGRSAGSKISLRQGLGAGNGGILK